jgi:thiamine-monophosphate kinase
MLFDPLAQTINAYNRNSEAYASQWFNSHSLEPFIEKFLKAMPNTGPVLDAGCGCGREINFLSKKQFAGLPLDCVGIDLSLGLVEQARSRVPRAIFRLMDLRDLEFPDSLFSGITCFAVWNHFFEEDIFGALAEFRRVLKPNGVVAITLKTGVDYEFDGLGRLTKYYEPEEILRFLKEYGFSIVSEAREDDSEGRKWFQVLARCEKQSDARFNPDCFFCMPWLFPQNKTQRYPVAGSILWGDSDIFCTVDCAPLVDGHLLLITGKHHYSYMSSDIPYAKILEHKEFARIVMQRVYQTTPTFMEHGTVKGGSGSSSCIEHAHLHALPLKRGIKKSIEESVGRLINYRDDETLRTLLGSKAYISYENKDGEIFVKSDGIENLESQFFRIIVGKTQKIENPKWAESLHDSLARARFHRSLQAIIIEMDKLQLERPILSRITETRRAKISAEVEHEDGASPSLVISNLRAKYDRKATLLDLGEKAITEEIIYKVFEGANQRTKILGDDAAIISLSHDVSSIVVSTDACPTPIIFNLEPANYHYYGWLSLVISISDIAAMGAEPLGALLACEMPEKMKVTEFIDFLEGVSWAADRFQCPIVGGNIKDARTFNVTSTIFGTTKDRKPLRRSGALPGQGVYAIGNMGYFWAAILNRQHPLVIPADMEAALENTLKFPNPNLHAGLYLSSLGIVGSCMDASDGPTGALTELAEKNNVDIVVDVPSLVPPAAVREVARQLKIDPRVLMFTWGNWELIFTADPESLNLRTRDHPIREEIIRLGSVSEGSGTVKMHPSGKLLPDLSSRRFTKESSFSHGLQAYLTRFSMMKF